MTDDFLHIRWTMQSFKKNCIDSFELTVHYAVLCTEYYAAFIAVEVNFVWKRQKLPRWAALYIDSDGDTILLELKINHFFFFFRTMCFITRATTLILSLNKKTVLLLGLPLTSGSPSLGFAPRILDAILRGSIRVRIRVTIS